MSSFNKAMELFWLVLAIVSAGLAAYLIATQGWEEGSLYLIFPAIAGFAFGVRRMMRKRMEKHLDDQGN